MFFEHEVRRSASDSALVATANAALVSSKMDANMHTNINTEAFFMSLPFSGYETGSPNFGILVGAKRRYFFDREPLLIVG